MLFSVAFSKDGQGRLSRNFGPLNNVGGQRRLNVAVTRARRQVIVYCSFDPEDLHSEGLAEGLQHLERYLRIARDGFESDGALASRRPSAPDRHRDQILSALRARGMRAEANIGLSEFKVDIAAALEAPEATWSVGILTDGPAWHERKTVGDRDSLPVSLLVDRMGWPVVTRIWTPDWLRDPTSVVDRIERLVQDAESADRAQTPQTLQTAPGPEPAASQASSTPITPTPATTSVTRANNSTASNRPESPFSIVPVWAAWSPKKLGPSFALEQLWDGGTQEYLRGVTRDIIRVEGPVHADRAARHIGRMHGLERVRGARVDAIKAVLTPAFILSPDGFYFLPEEGPDRYARWFRSDGASRNIEEISLEEISNAMRDVARVGLGASRDELVSSTAGAFGYQRVTAGIRDRMDRGLAVGLKRGVLREQNGYVVSV